MGTSLPVTALTTDAAPAVMPVPVAFLGRTSTLVMQDPVQSLNRQLREVQAKLPPGWFIAAYYWDIESGGMDLDQRGRGTAHQGLQVGIPRDGGMADLLAEAARPEPRFAAVMCEDIERSGRDTFDALRLEKHLGGAGIPLLATDEPIDVGGMNATTLLVRRVKQGIAEWYRFQLKDKAWKGLREHALAGYNIGPVPYGYAASRTPHPVPAKAAAGATKTRLVIDPDRALAVAQIFAWRTQDKIGRKTIAARLAADPTVPRPAKGAWTVSGVSAILSNPKYTGHMVFGRQRTINGKMTPVPPSEWLWSPEPTHPAIITRQAFDDAQTVGAEHGTSRDGTGPSSDPRARRVYALRGRIRHRTCHRRMHGITRPSSRYYTGGPDKQLTYYLCPHDPAEAAAPEAEAHPRTVSIREDLLTERIRRFFDLRIFGPERRALLEQQFPAGAAEKAARDQATADALGQRLRQIETAENAHAREIEALATETTAAPAAVTALRTRILARFTELEEERAAINGRLAALDRDQPAAPDLDLLEKLPVIGDLLARMPARLHARLYDAFGIELLYRHDINQVTIHATITTATPAALHTIITLCDNPTPDLAAALSDLEPHPGGSKILRDHGEATEAAGWKGGSRAGGRCGRLGWCLRSCRGWSCPVCCTPRSCGRCSLPGIRGSGTRRR
jgi:site-specific DNA recombinase